MKMNGWQRSMKMIYDSSVDLKRKFKMDVSMRDRLKAKNSREHSMIARSSLKRICAVFTGWYRTIKAVSWWKGGCPSCNAPNVSCGHHQYGWVRPRRRTWLESDRSLNISCVKVEF